MATEYVPLEAVKAVVCETCEKPSCPELWGGDCSLMGLLIDLPAADVVDRDCFNRILSENDTMREQLASIGKKPGDSMDDVRLVVRGEWVPYPVLDDMYDKYYKCSVCGCIVCVPHRQNISERKPFCMCGACMRKEAKNGN